MGLLLIPKRGSLILFASYALKHLGANVPSSEELEWCIGPPLVDSFSILLKDAGEKLILEAVELYRVNFKKKGLLECFLYEGIVDVLNKLTERNFSIYLATAKPKVFADEILKNLNIYDLFSNVYGSELDGTRNNKTELIDYIIKKEGLIRAETVMIGDRENDIVGANNNNILSCGVLYGYGSKAELIEADADIIISKPEYLLDIF
jgi:phosphoglycolate phosphatase